MSVLQKNILSNVLGSGWSLLIGLVFVPLYIRFLGIEAYGLVGVFVALQATTGLLEFGLSSTISRELARYSVWPERSDEARDLARTLEIIYWVTGFLIMAGVFASAPWIATHWVRAETLSKATVRQVVTMMGVTLAFQWPAGLYGGGLMGLERQVLQNGLLAVLGTVRGLGAVLVLWLIAPTITVFFGWQALVSVIQISAIALMFWRSMPAGSRAARFDIKLLRSVWRFTVGMGATGVVTFLVSQLDKVVLSRMLTLSLFGYYNLSNQLNAATRMFGGSIFVAFFPRLSALLAKEDGNTLRRLYHSGCQLVSLVVLPASIVTAFFAYEIIRIWTQNETMAHMASSIASVLIIGSALNSMLGLPYALTVARGWASFGFYQNLISGVLLVPVMLVLVARFGGIGAAVAWLLLNAGYMTMSAPIIHHRILPGELRQWYLVDVGRPFVLSVVIASCGRWLWPRETTLWLQLFVIMGLWFLALAVCAISLPDIRERAWQMMCHRTGVGYRPVHEGSCGSSVDQ
jgi:O-antigen/teichoic acid export membrane protein